MRRVALALATSMAWLGSANAQPADWGVTRDPFDATVAARYRAILVKNPYDEDALKRLQRMYTQYRTDGELLGLYDKPTDWASAVVWARLTPGDSELWRKVLAYKADDARALRELADLERNADNTIDAMTHFEGVVKLATDTETKKHALQSIAELAEAKLDITKLEWAYGELVALEPKQPKHWVDRGIAERKLNRYSDAINSFAKAEAMMATDPQGKLDVLVMRARALQSSGDNADAEIAYALVLKLAPRGYYLADEAIAALVEIHRSDNTLADFEAALEKRWPAGSRGYFEWKTLATIYQDLGQDEQAIAALKKAVAVAPSELETQNKLIQLLDSYGQGDDALAQLEAATKAIPGDESLHVTLATRYHDAKQTKQAIATLQRLSKNVRNDARLHQNLVELYTKWRRPGLALHELEEVARIEPEIDNLVALGEAYWAGGNEEKALATWKKMSKDPDGLARLGQVYVDHELYGDAIVVYGQGINLAPKNAELLRARAEVHETLGHWDAAYADLRSATELIKGRSLDEGHQIRYQLVRLLSRWSEDASTSAQPTPASGALLNGDELTPLQRAVNGWTLAFNRTPPDIEAGYMLAEYEGRSPSTEQLGALLRLHALVPNDLGVQQTLARTYKILHRYTDAIAELKELTTADPNRAGDYQDQIADLNKRLALAGDEGWRDDGIADPDAWIRAHRKPDPIAPFRIGLRMGVGTAMRGPSPHSVLVGAYTSIRIGHKLAFVGRFDWSERGGDMTSVKAAAVSTGIAFPLVDLRRTIVTLGAANRTELRVGDHMGWDRLGLAGDLTLEIVPKKMPGSLGVRLEQGITDHGQSTTLLLELGLGN